MGIIGNGLMVSLIPKETITNIKKGRLKEFPNDLLKVVTKEGNAIGVVVELELTPTDYEKRESLVICDIQEGCSEDIKSGFENIENFPVYKFDIKRR